MKDLEWGPELGVLRKCRKIGDPPQQGGPPWGVRDMEKGH